MGSFKRMKGKNFPNRILAVKVINNVTITAMGKSEKFITKKRKNMVPRYGK